jgi:acyl-CoA thioester hydrolase
VESRASLARANELALPRTALGAVRAGDCDAFGRMRTELMMARISDGIPHFFEGRRPGDAENGARTGGAALEYRLIHLDWPGAGDRVELRSAASPTGCSTLTPAAPGASPKPSPSPSTWRPAS